MLLILLTLGCGTETITVDLEPCTDYSFDVDEPYFETSVEGGVMDVRRVGLFHTCDTDFDPLVELAGRELHVYEAWMEGECSGECCFEAVVQVSGSTRNAYEVTWHATGDGESWTETVEF